MQVYRGETSVFFIARYEVAPNSARHLEGTEPPTGYDIEKVGIKITNFFSEVESNRNTTVIDESITSPMNFYVVDRNEHKTLTRYLSNCVFETQHFSVEDPDSDAFAGAHFNATESLCVDAGTPIVFIRTLSGEDEVGGLVSAVIVQYSDDNGEWQNIVLGDWTHLIP